MKRAELEVGKAYYKDTRADWSSHYLYNCQTKTQVALKLRPHHRVTIKETQLKTEYDRKYRTNKVLVAYANGREEWVPLAHIREEYALCIGIIFNRSVITDGMYRTNKYAEHLRRKRQREEYNPAYRAMIKALEEFKGGYISDYDRVGSAFSIEQLNAINAGLALLKTQKPELQVAS